MLYSISSYYKLLALFSVLYITSWYIIYFVFSGLYLLVFPGPSDSKVSLPAMRKTWVQSLSWEDSPGEGNGYPLTYSCLENSMERVA